jgi:hypothetical protein
VSKPRVLRGKARTKPKKHRGPCYVKGCKVNGGLMHHCKICEALVEAGKQEEAYTVQFCGNHLVEAAAKMKRHVLLKHPGTLPSWLLHKLTGGI